MKTNRLGLYAHIPFCERKCNYCDFVSFTGKDEKDFKKYVDELLKEIKDRGSKDYHVDSLYIGGGTPSILPSNLMERLLRKAYDSFKFLKDLEVTIEVNPATVDKEKLNTYRSLGINRISMGVQSFDDTILKKLGRIHSKKDVTDSYNLIRKAGFNNVSLDLMYAVPGQSEALWTESLKEAVLLEPEHISCYSLSLEEGTDFYDSFNKGTLKLPSYDEDAKMYLITGELLSKAGYHRYEISNYCKEGYASRHNLKYWNMEEYLGLGVSAHSFLNGTRIENHHTLNEYYGRDKVKCTHENTEYDNISEFIFMGLRKTEGISLKDFEDRFSIPYKVYLKDRQDLLKALIDQGFILEEEGRIKYTLKGILDSNRITIDLM